jgi:hypothetical protein
MQLCTCLDNECGGTGEAFFCRKEFEWTLDNDHCWNICWHEVHIWIQPRIWYCDRGHWVGDVAGIPYMDISDAFPRYYMDLDRAKLEMLEWLIWRLTCLKRSLPKEYALLISK